MSGPCECEEAQERAREAYDKVHALMTAVRAYVGPYRRVSDSAALDEVFRRLEDVEDDIGR